MKHSFLIILLAVMVTGELYATSVDAQLQYIPTANYICNDSKSCIEGMEILFTKYQNTKYVAFQPLTLQDCLLLENSEKSDWIFYGLSDRNDLIPESFYQSQLFARGIFYECGVMLRNNNMIQILASYFLR